MTAPKKLKILFLCTGNSCRSQMAEGWARHIHPDKFEVYSAGVKPKKLDPRAVAVMAEAGVDISSHYSKHVDTLKDIAFDSVITVCDSARESCPHFPANVKHIHVDFQDPPTLATDAANESEALAHYHRIRDQIRAFVEKLPQQLT